MAEVVIREAVASDFDAWCDLYELVASERIWIAGEPPVNRDVRRKWFDDHLAGEAGVVLIADADGVQVGHLGIDVRQGVAEIGMLLAPEVRGRGIGSQLMDACIAWCRNRDVHKIALQLWPENAGARRLYEKFGFAEEGRLVRHYRRRSGELWDALVMGLVLDTTSPGRSA